MFPFRSRRSNLTRRLSKATRRGVAGCSPQADAIAALLKKLQDVQLETLFKAVESRGREPTGCVLLPFKEEPHLLCCQTWRWPDLRSGEELRRLPSCRSRGDKVYVCCNPYHWSRICVPDCPPPPYSRTNEEMLRPEDRAPSEVPLLCRDSYPGSFTTNGDTPSNPSEWCKLAYWELSERVGPLFSVDRPSFNVFGDVPHPDGLSLETLAMTGQRNGYRGGGDGRGGRSPPPDAAVQRTRCKIGLGVTLSREEDSCVWVYNRSDNPIFVNSATLDVVPPPEQTHMLAACHQPTRVPADHCLCVYDPNKAAQNYGWTFTHPIYGPVDPNSIRISFVKGWGQKYSRREIKSCPCWLEILLAPCR
ncbi:unnamed protein product [Callosobruchus maculatus]|uniref:Mothers against decapentaplegic homolog n=1 Tax=Callosobruchus maculatus TaxID=64391 RepID=A0A653BL71_CALMS|nr:unnamed protein product [Callosobruchus maculatus]